jgi:hypothetical protein
MRGVTSGQLDKVLRSLGFSCRTATLQTKAHVYEHAETGALIVLPVVAESKKALPHSLAAVRGTLELFGIADPPDFAAELQKAS